MVGLWERRDSLVEHVLRRHEAAPGDRARAACTRRACCSSTSRPSGLDPQTRSSIWGYIRELKAREDITIFLTTHYMDEAEYCDRIAIMDQGQIIVLDTPEALKASVGKDRVQIQTDDDAGGDRRAARALRDRGDGRRGRGHVRRRRGRAVRAAAVRRARPADPLGERLAPVARRRVHVLHRHHHPRRRVRPDRHAAQLRADDEPLMATRGEPLMATETTAPRQARQAPRSGCAEPAAGRTPRDRARARAHAQRAQRAARDQGRVAARADPLQPRPAADPHLADAAVPVPVRARHRPLAAGLGRHARRQPAHVRLPRRAVHGGDVHRDVLRRVARVGPRVRVPARDDGRARAAQLARPRQVPRRRDRRGLPGRDRARASRASSASPTRRL